MENYQMVWLVWYAQRVNQPTLTWKHWCYFMAALYGHGVHVCI